MLNNTKRFAIALVCILTLLLLPTAFGQETTAGLQGTVKDASGAVVSNATVEVTSPALIGAKTLETDKSGYYHFSNLPPGVYTITVSAATFSTNKVQDVNLAVGKNPTIDVVLKPGGASETVEVSGAAPLVDITQSKVQTNITQEVLAEVPKGTSYQSVIQFAPGARNEPLQAPTGGNAITGGYSNHQGTNQGNGFQIDGASNTENSYLVEGQETASAFDGASAANVPMEFIQEVQVKTSGFEPEYGGALGGVVNVIQKRGSNEWHGSLFTYYSGDAFDAAPNKQLRGDPQSSAVGRIDQAPQFYQPKKDHYRTVEPGFEIGGDFIKNRLWAFSSFAPHISSLDRTVNFLPSAPVPGSRTFHENIDTYYSLNRLDFLATQKIRLFGSWQYGYERGSGTTLPLPDSAYGQNNNSAGTNTNNYNEGIGYTAPNVLYGTGADITLTPNLVATTRFGYFYQDYQDRGLPTGIRYIYRNTNYPYSTGSATKANATFAALDGSALPAQFQQSTGFSNIGANSQTLYDKFKRTSLNQDLAYFKKAFGLHNLKVGYGFARNYNDALSSAYNTADVYVGYGLGYSPQLPTTGQTNCDAIIAANVAKYGAAAANAGCQGNYGTVNFRDVSTKGQVTGWNHAIYVQDAWTVGHGLTINAGVRMEKESIPSYSPSLKGIDFGWGQKAAPRFGAAWDVLGNGKVKVFGSFGYFYQVMNLQLARGSWGGDYWHDCVYALDTANYASLIPTRNAAGAYCPTGGGTAPANGTFPAGSLRFIENVDYRTPSNDPNSPGSLGATGLVDPNLSPMKQHEMVLGSEFELKKNLGLEVRYSRKRLDRTIEDAGTITADGEQYYIVNPGYGVNAMSPASECTSCPANPKAMRNYDGVESRLTYRGTGRFFGALSYTYSRYYGNYSGLTSTDQSDSNLGGARNGANSDRAFDEPYMSFDSHGKAIDGPLSTDRPHTFKAYGYYRLKWLHMQTNLGAFQQWYSGTPLSSYMSVFGAPVFVEGRGNVANVTTDAAGNWVLNGVSAQRTPSFSQTDLNLVHEVHVSKTNEKLVAGFEANITNVFNQHAPVDYNDNLIASSGGSQIKPYACSRPGVSCLATDQAGYDYKSVLSGYNYIQEANSALNKTAINLNRQYGMPYLFQGGRSMRFKFRFTF
jgi:hypothetical protein